VRVFGHLKKYYQRDSSSEFKWTTPRNTTVKDLLDSLGISEEVIILINDEHTHHREVVLRENDRVWIYPPLDGG